MVKGNHERVCLKKNEIDFDILMNKTMKDFFCV